MVPVRFQNRSGWRHDLHYWYWLPTLEPAKGILIYTHGIHLHLGHGSRVDGRPLDMVSFYHQQWVHHFSDVQQGDLAHRTDCGSQVQWSCMVPYYALPLEYMMWSSPTLPGCMLNLSHWARPALVFLLLVPENYSSSPPMLEVQEKWQMTWNSQRVCASRVDLARRKLP